MFRIVYSLKFYVHIITIVPSWVCNSSPETILHILHHLHLHLEDVLLPDRVPLTDVDDGPEMLDFIVKGSSIISQVTSLS